ncbi:perlucin-like protein [Mizuhopecten yessoensis]|uniref:Aggrecan core protein n=1 Tax=Mizuhopecten yessoensis TaxID=6573 RepID=A0A210R383_MIZYE|nr:perlucin-like protein [Mizuhopecten yessoensis]OWF55386.1 Aggrecan core protein [Mizuhopecten yessoensis]
MVLRLGLLLCVGLPLVLATCQIGWTEYKEDCIWFSQGKKSWNDAEADCRSKTAWLLSDDSQDKHDFLATILNVLRGRGIAEWFIGATDYTFEGSFRWLETGGPLTFTKWAPGQPNGTTVENCLTLKWVDRELLWEDEKCSSRGKRANNNNHTHVHHTHPPPMGMYYYICETRNGDHNSGPVFG